MRGNTILARVARSQMGLLLVTLLALAAGLGVAVASSYTALMEHHLEEQAVLVRELAAGRPAAGLDALAKALGRQQAARVTFIAADGTVLGDSDADPAGMENHAGRPEVAAALAGRVGTQYRFSSTLRQDTLYKAVPMPPGSAAAVARLALAMTRVYAALVQLARVLLAIIAVVGLGALVVSWRAATRLVAPVNAISRAAQQIAAGNLAFRVYQVDAPEEIHRLGESLNHMADVLRDRLAEVSESRDLLGAVMTQLPVGVVCINRGGYLALVNPAGHALLGLAPDDLGRHHAEAVRSSALTAAIDRALRAGPEGGATDVALELQGRHIGATVAVARARGVAAVVVARDVTETRRVEAMRRDLIANVSHELKTPVTAILGFAETLLQGALDEAAERRRFVAIIELEARRLRDLIADLLDLARLESDPAAVRPVPTDLAGVVRKAAARLGPRVEGAGQTLTVEAPDRLPAWVDPPRIDQILTNLVENSVQHTPAGGRVTIRLWADGEGALLAVEDTGTGIPPADLARIFERFYRVERGRSRRTGGTGLGLAIVKHIAEGHGGRAWAQSDVGQGTTVWVLLPWARLSVTGPT